jgi:hypothetical protein
VDKEEWKSFLRWLDQASAEELRIRKSRLTALRRDLDDRDIRADANRMIRLIDQDLLAREGVSQRLRGKRSQDA